jgi:L,D-transpeptidase YcbB
LTILWKLPFLLFFCVLFLPSGMLQAQDDPVTEILRQSLEGVETETVLSVGACRVSSWPVLPKIYERHEYHPFWTSPEAVTQFVAAIRESYDEGLNPQDYHLKEILGLIAKKSTSQTSDPTLAASLDLLLTDAFVRLASHSLFGRKDPATHQPKWKNEAAAGGGDPVDYFEKALTFPSITTIVDSWKVHYAYYEDLKQALANYRAIRAKGGWKAVPDGNNLSMGATGTRVQALRRRLAVEYPGLGLGLDRQLFDAELYRAVRHFQARHSLRQDGVVDRETLAALNVPVDYRIDQIRINLERDRWVLRNLGDPFVLVDIVGFKVYFQEGGRVVWSGRAQVGQPFRDTPVLRSVITYIEFNPTWTIPPTVRDEDILPALKKDSGYLRKHNIVIMDKDGLAPVKPQRLDNLPVPTPEQPFPYRLVQNPGPDNPLGRIKIMFPNPHSVYLHDTPSKFLFDREERTFSSGCIRVERPFELASLLFPAFCGWTPKKLMKEGSNGLNWRLDLPLPVPILVMYSTVIVDQDGVPFFRKDLYNRDPAMLEELGRDLRTVPGGA